jgi:hypothetical protein
MARSIAVVMVNYRTPALALASLATLAGERITEPGLRVVLVDGGSGDGSADTLARGLDDPRFAGWVELLPLSINGGFGWANNQAMLRLLQASDPPDYIHLLNPDTAIEPGAVARLADVLDEHSRCAAVGSLLLEPDGSPSGSAFAFPTIRRELVRGVRMEAIKRLVAPEPLVWFGEAAVEVDWATGASVMMRAEALRDVGLFDTGFFLYFEEVELMWRIRRAGWSIRHEPLSRVGHVGGAATGVNGSRPTALRPALPAYWYASRRRFLALTGARWRSVAASLAWLVGHGLLNARRLAGGARQHAIVEGDARALLRAGLWPTSSDRTPAVARWTDPIDRPPAWMDRPPT